MYGESSCCSCLIMLLKQALFLRISYKKMVFQHSSLPGSDFAGQPPWWTPHKPHLKLARWPGLMFFLAKALISFFRCDTHWSRNCSIISVADHRLHRTATSGGRFRSFVQYRQRNRNLGRSDHQLRRYRGHARIAVQHYLRR